MSTPDSGNLTARQMNCRVLLLIAGGVLFIVGLVLAIVLGVNRWVVPTTDAFKQYAAATVGTSDPVVGTVQRVEPVPLGSVKYNINSINGSSRRFMRFSVRLEGSKGTAKVTLFMTRNDPDTTWTVVNKVAGAIEKQ